MQKEKINLELIKKIMTEKQDYITIPKECGLGKFQGKNQNG